jgi:hypothetical protein
LISQQRVFRPEILSLRQDTQSGHSFSAPDKQSEARRTRPFPAIVRTMRTGWRAHFGPFAVSLAPLSRKQPNHGRFGTVVRRLPDQWVMRCQLGRGFESAALRRSEQGSNHSIQYGCRGDKDRAPRGVAGADRRGRCRAGLARLTVRIGHLNQSRSPATTSRLSRSGSPRSSTTMAARLASSARRLRPGERPRPICLRPEPASERSWAKCSGSATRCPPLSGRLPFRAHARTPRA